MGPCNCFPLDFAYGSLQGRLASVESATWSADLAGTQAPFLVNQQHLVFADHKKEHCPLLRRLTAPVDVFKTFVCFAIPSLCHRWRFPDPSCCRSFLVLVW
jgi:hypothetical protein